VGRAIAACLFWQERQAVLTLGFLYGLATTMVSFFDYNISLSRATTNDSVVVYIMLAGGDGARARDSYPFLSGIFLHMPPWHVTWDVTSILINRKLHTTSHERAGTTLSCVSCYKPLDSV
jgi:hypothetical protein